MSLNPEASTFCPSGGGSEASSLNPPVRPATILSGHPLSDLTPENNPSPSYPTVGGVEVSVVTPPLRPAATLSVLTSSSPTSSLTPDTIPVVVSPVASVPSQGRGRNYVRSSVNFRTFYWDDRPLIRTVGRRDRAFFSPFT